MFKPKSCHLGFTTWASMGFGEWIVILEPIIDPIEFGWRPFKVYRYGSRLPGIYPSSL